MHDPIDGRPTPLPFRDHTILGVCEAIGEDFGFNPVWLRVPLAACVLLSLKYAIVGYLALGVMVLGSRLLFPNPKVQQQAAIEPRATASPDQIEDHELPLAA